MKAVIYEAFGVPPQLKNVPDPTPEIHGRSPEGQNYWRLQRIARLSTQPIYILRKVLQHLTNQRVVAPTYHIPARPDRSGWAKMACL